MTIDRTRSLPPALSLSIVLGTNEIASAIAIRLKRSGHAVIMCHDRRLPVIRRGMAFYDAAFGDATSVAGVAAAVVDCTSKAEATASLPDRIAVTRLDFTDLMVLGPFALLVDARMHKNETRPDLRHLARLAVGIGPGYHIGENCDLAIETKPSRVGILIVAGHTAAADGVSRKLGIVGRERFVYSGAGGPWRTALDVGMRVFKGFPIGRLGSAPVLSPLDGVLRGIARDGIDVPQSVKLVEIDTRGRRAAWIGIDDRGRAIADATLDAVERYATASRHSRTLVPPG